MADDVTPAGTSRSPRPVAEISSMPSGRRASSASAPSSIGTPATADADSFPPSRGEPSRTVTRTGSSLSEKAAASPVIPPPTTTTWGAAWGVCVMVYKPATYWSEQVECVWQGADDREARFGRLSAGAIGAAPALADDLDRTHADRLGACAEPGLVVDHHGVRGRHAERLEGVQVYLRRRLQRADLVGQDGRVRQRDHAQVLKHLPCAR